MSLQSAERLGVVVPSGNAAAEPEIAGLVRPAMNVHTSRFPVLPGRTLRERLDAYNEGLDEVVAGFGGLKLGAVVVACSGSHYLLGPDGDRALCEKLADAGGRPVASSTLATLDTCADLGVRDIVLVSPYEPWLTDLSRTFWEQAGLTVSRVVPIRAGDRFSPYDVSTGDLVRQVAEAGLGDDEALLLTGTGMFTFEALRQIGQGNDRVLLTSNICSARWALKQTGLPADPAEETGLLRRLAARTGGTA
ncbi:aspartate racemase/maleate isomerase family protein [Streptomyces rishiriensis]|uniref:aspartate racemase/maleate isomerase family protein n=1 Tax=Streptomyces rishiriensis TaxID=68264 RepID=UPI0037CD5014